jgi:hypothetical protein
LTIGIWADFDLYHRNYNNLATQYEGKPAGIPDFLFSFHNFEDFIALHLDDEWFEEWLRFGRQGHFREPLHSCDYIPEFRRICPDYKKADVPVDFISWDSLRNLKRHLPEQPITNPWNWQGLSGFADFLVHELEAAYPTEMA